MKTIIKPLMMGLIIIAGTRKAAAQMLRNTISMPYLSLSAYSAGQQDAFSFTSNQASLARIRTGAAGMYAERRFMLSGNDAYALAAAIPSAMGGFGLQVNYAGQQNFHEQQAGAAYARSLGKKADLGVQFNYYSYKIPGYGQASAAGFEAGFIAHLSEKMTAGIHTANPAGGKFGKSGEEKLPAVYKFGIGYDASENFYAGLEAVKEESSAAAVIAGFQYRFKKQVFARAGFRSDNNTGFFGIGFIYRQLRIDVAASYHPQLGMSPGILLMYPFKSDKK